MNNNFTRYDFIVQAYNKRNYKQFMIQMHDFYKKSLFVKFEYSDDFESSGFSDVLISILTENVSINVLDITIQIIVNLSSYVDENRFIDILISKDLFIQLINIIKNLLHENYQCNLKELCDPEIILRNVFRIVSNCCLSNTSIRNTFLSQINLCFFVEPILIKAIGYNHIVKLFRQIIYFDIDRTEFLEISKLVFSLYNQAKEICPLEFIKFIFFSMNYLDYVDKEIISDFIHFFIIHSFMIRDNQNRNFPIIFTDLLSANKIASKKVMKAIAILCELFLTLIDIFPDLFHSRIHIFYQALLQNMELEFKDVSDGSSSLLNCIIIKHLDFLKNEDLEIIFKKIIQKIDTYKQQTQIKAGILICKLLPKFHIHFIHTYIPNLYTIFSTLIYTDSPTLQMNILASIINIQTKEELLENRYNIIEEFVNSHSSQIEGLIEQNDNEVLRRISTEFINYYENCL